MRFCGPTASIPAAISASADRALAFHLRGNFAQVNATGDLRKPSREFLGGWILADCHAGHALGFQQFRQRFGIGRQLGPLIEIGLQQPCAPRLVAMLLVNLDQFHERAAAEGAVRARQQPAEVGLLARPPAVFESADGLIQASPRLHCPWMDTA